MPSATTSRRTGCITNRGLMYKGWFTKIFGTQFQRELKRIRPIVDAIHGHEARLKGLSDGELQGQTPKLRGLIADRTSTPAAEGERVRQGTRLHSTDELVAYAAFCLNKKNTGYLILVAPE